MQSSSEFSVHFIVTYSTVNVSLLPELSRQDIGEEETDKVDPFMNTMTLIYMPKTSTSLSLQHTTGK